MKERYGRLKIINRVEDKIYPSGQKQQQWECLCDCGNLKIVLRTSLTSGSTRSCGCLGKESREKKTKILSQGVFGRLTTTSDEFFEGGRWQCKVSCLCGKAFTVRGDSLTSGNTTSCGCLHKETISKRFTKHARSKSSLYKNYHGILQRCYNKDSLPYNEYGGRGITVCDRWLESFENFLEDMGERPSKTHSIDRIDVNGNYEPSNCRWATTSQQAFNKRRKSSNLTGRTNVHWSEKRKHYFVTVSKEYKAHYGGSSKDLQEAIRLAEALEIKLFGEIKSDEYRLKNLSSRVYDE